MNERELRSLSKQLSYVLRHDPASVGIVLDEAGWVSVSELLAALVPPVTEADLRQVVATSDKQRFALDDVRGLIRANQGHSVEVKLGLSPSAPPEVLFHGTVDKFLPSIREQGLRPGSRQQVHLSADLSTAQVVAKRRGKPVILQVAAGLMAAGGIQFYRADNGVWLTDAVAPEYLSFPE